MIAWLYARLIMSKLNHKRMIFVGNHESIDFYKYSPSLLKHYYMDYPIENHPIYEKRIIHRVRMMLEYIRGGYNVIYMAKDDEIIGHIVVARGGRRLEISTNNDIKLL